MSYQNLRSNFNKESFHFIELSVNGEIIRFCDNTVSPMPAGFEGYPFLVSFDMSPAQIDITGGIGIRSTASAKVSSFQDFSIYGNLLSPIDFWRAWRAKNRNYRYQRVSHFSGYLDNGEFNQGNFIQRDFVIESIAQAGDGVAISLRDPLMLTNDSKAKLPLESKGALLADVLSGASSFSVAPAGIGSTYPASNFYIRINDEVMLVGSRSGDTFNSITRAQFGTLAEDHSEDDAVQECLWIDNLSVSEIGYLLLTEGAGVDPSYINQGEWDALSSASFPNTYSALITEPTGVRKMLSELCESAPHYYFYDTRNNAIRFKPQQAPQNTGQILTWEGNLLEGRTSIRDRQDLHVTTVLIYFGIRNPTKDLDETTNYRKLYVREDSQAVIDNGGTREYKVVYSRWIGNETKSAAVLAASLTGRRFAIPPWEVTYELDPKDGNVWTGDGVRIETDLILNPDTLDIDRRVYQVISAKEDTDSQRFKYTALEHTYGPPVDGDEDVEDPNTRLVYIDGEYDQLKDGSTGLTRTLRDIYFDVYPDLQASYDVRFIFESGAITGSSTNAEPGVKTGSWPELTTAPLIVNNGLILGKGGDGSNVNSATVNDGGVALVLQNAIRLDNNGIIGGGGGGGGSVSSPGGRAVAAGGGGAGYFIGAGGLGTNYTPGSDASVVTQAESGTYTEGGDGGQSSGTTNGEPASVTGGDGGDLGQPGGVGGGAAGDAIQTNGYSINYINAGDIRGSISA